MKRILVVIFSFLLGCTANYEEGPPISFLSKKNRVTNSWKVASCSTENGADCASEFEEYENHILREDEKWIIQIDEENVVGGGTWYLNSKGDRLLYYSANESVLESFTYKIIMLKKTRMKVIDEKNRTIEFEPI